MLPPGQSPTVIPKTVPQSIPSRAVRQYTLRRTPAPVTHESVVGFQFVFTAKCTPFVSIVRFPPQHTGNRASCELKGGQCTAVYEQVLRKRGKKKR